MRGGNNETNKKPKTKEKGEGRKYDENQGKKK